MKKLILFFFIFMPSAISALDMNRVSRSHFPNNFDFRWNLGNIGYERNFQKNSDIVFFDFLDISFIHNRTRIGLEFTPIRFWEWRENDSENITNGSFLNFGIFWNTFDTIFYNDSLNFFVGPFNRIHYIHSGNRNASNSRGFVYTVGLRFGLVASDYGITVNNLLRAASINFVRGEVGFRNINGFNTFYASVSTNIALFIFIYFLSLFNYD